MMRYLPFIISLFFINKSFGQITTVTRYSELILDNHNFGLTNPVFDEGSQMTYDVSKVSSLGGAFSINYTNGDGLDDGFDGYPSGSIGGFKTGGTYYPGNLATSGMPIQIKNLENDLRIRWKTFQENANDIDDKWWATINVIFDGSEDPNSEPIASDRDFDIVIEFERYEQDDLTDKAKGVDRAYWYFARNQDESLKPFSLNLDGLSFEWAVRYKFFSYSTGHPNEHKNNKVHIKFIPIDNNNVAPYLDDPLKKFIDCSVDFLQYIEMTSEEDTLANEKVANPDLWIKSISAGYEIYTGNSILGNEYFYSVIDNEAPETALNLTIEELNNEAVLNWDAHIDDSFLNYAIYRSENSEPFVLYDEIFTTNSYTDMSVINGNSYEYYIKIIDRSLNESTASLTKSITIGSPLSLKDEELIEFNLYPNPVSSRLHLNGDTSTVKFLEVYNTVGIKQNVIIQKNQNKISLQLEALSSGLYFVRINNNVHKIIKK